MTGSHDRSTWPKMSARLRSLSTRRYTDAATSVLSTQTTTEVADTQRPLASSLKKTIGCTGEPSNVLRTLPIDASQYDSGPLGVDSYWPITWLCIRKLTTHGRECARCKHSIPDGAIFLTPLSRNLWKYLPNSPSSHQHPQYPDRTFSAYARGSSKAYAVKTRSSQELLPPWQEKLGRTSLRITGLHRHRNHRKSFKN